MKKVFKYDIFISYKHEELDKAVAARLQRKLEQYKIPREIKLKIGKKKIERVFRDEEELSISSDLGKEIEGQLKESEYLLLVCSKKTKDSPWVLREIETFLKYQDIDHVLPVLIEGEPEEVFPEIILQYGEPLAVDLRDTSKKKILKNADKELPRILAPVLHCSYDELKQRHKMYRMYRLLGIAGIGMGVAIIFAAYAIIQSQKLEKQYQATRKNQARYLCNVSTNLLESGDRIGALQTAMGVLPENENDNKPVVLEQMNALNNALYSYKRNDLLYFRANRMEEFKGDLSNEIKFSKQGTYCVAVDSIGYVYFFDGKTGKLLWKRAGITKDKEQIYAAAPLDENKAVIVTESKLVVVNIKNKKIISQKIYKREWELEMENVLVSKNKVFLWNNGEIIVVDLAKKKQTKESITRIQNIEQVIMDKSGEQLFIAIGGEGKDKSNPVGIYKYEISAKKLSRISRRATEKICLINKDYIAAVQYTDYKYRSLFDSKITYCLSIYNMNNGKSVWEQNNLKDTDTNTRAECKIFNIKEKNNKKVLVFYFKRTVYCLDANSYKLISKKIYDSNIIGISQYDNSRLLIGLENGSIYAYTGYNKKNLEKEDYSDWTKKLSKVGEIRSDSAVKYFSYNMESKTAVEYSEKKIVFLRIIQDKKVKVFNKSKYVNNVSYFKIRKGGEKIIYRCVYYLIDEEKGQEEIDIYKSGKSDAIYKIILDQEESVESEIIALRNNKPTLCYMIRKSNSDNSGSADVQFYMVDLETRKEIQNYKLSKIESLWSDMVVYASDLSYVWMIEYGGRSWSMNLKERKLKLKEEKQWNLRNEILVVKKTRDDRYIIFSFAKYDNGGIKNFLKIWDRKNNNWKVIEGKEKIEDLENEKGFSVGKKRNMIAVAKNNGQVQIIDIDHGTVKTKVELYKRNEKENINSADMEFFNNDKLLLKMSKDKDLLNIVDTERGEIVAEINYEFPRGELIVDDSSKYFGIKSRFFGRNDNEVNKEVLSIYIMDNDKREFIKYADIDYGWASFEGNEIIGGKSEWNNNLTYYTKIYDFLQLRKEAEQILKGEQLTKEKSKKYFLEK